MKNITVSKVAEALGIEGGGESQVTGYHIDSRLVEPGGLFFALRGLKSDGHDFLGEAAKKGVIAAVVQKDYLGPDFGLILLRVEDVVKSLQGLARTFMRGCRSKIIGITGSLGKTTTKEFVWTLLSEKYKVLKSPLNYNTKLTLPLTLLNRVGDEDVLVVELGMSEPKDISRLVEIVALDIAVLTKVARVHLENFPRGLLDIALGKAEIFENERTKVAIFDYGLYEYGEAIKKIHGKTLSFSVVNENADLFFDMRLRRLKMHAEVFDLDLPFFDEHILHNFLAAVMVAKEVGMSFDEIAKRVPFLTLPKMRLEKIEIDGVLFINDAYNASPDSMKAALKAVSCLKREGRRIAVLGMMAEMGKTSVEIHEEVGAFAKDHIDFLFTLGKGSLPILKAFEREGGVGENCVDFDELFGKLKPFLSRGDVVLVKASRFVGMEKLFEMLKR